MPRKTDKECAQELVASAMVANGSQKAAVAIIRGSGLTPEEMVRGAVYIKSGQKVTGKGR
jgi:hypothetical protein